MRVLLDANIFISFLLYTGRDSPAPAIVRAAIARDFVLLLPHELTTEFVKKAATKPYLAKRIRPEELEELARLLLEVAEIIPRIPDPIPALTRDPKDDYLIAYATVGEADYLVTGDHHLLELGEIDTLKIVSPRTFVTMLGQG